MPVDCCNMERCPGEGCLHKSEIGFLIIRALQEDSCAVIMTKASSQMQGGLCRSCLAS